MAAKLLHSLTEDNPDLQKQIGCMTGVFQLFDRHQMVAGRRFPGHSPKRLPPGSPQFDNGTPESESSNSYQRPYIVEKHSNKIMQDKHRASTESSRDSFSSMSRSSSFSSLECNINRTIHPEPDHLVFPETPSRQSCGSQQTNRQSVDLRDVVKDSMYREPRSSLQKPKDESINYRESLDALAKYQEASWYYNEPRELSRSKSYQFRDGSSFSVPKDCPRFSYDGRESNRLSLQSRENPKTINLKQMEENPRLSLDSRENSNRSLNTNLTLKNTSQSRPPSVVAKLMGLTTLPDSASASTPESGVPPIKTSIDNVSSLPKLKSNDFFGPIKMHNSSRTSIREPTSPSWKNHDMKPISRFPMEPAPWKNRDGSRSPQRPGSRGTKSPTKIHTTYSSVYSEVDKRLKDLEFTQSGKDLRALKQILEAMQSMESRNKGPQVMVQRHNISTQNERSRAYESPIVIMKPATKLVDELRNKEKKISINNIPKSTRSNNNDVKTGGRNTRSVQGSTKQQQLTKENTVKVSGSVSPRLQQKRVEVERRSRPPTPPAADFGKLRKPVTRQVVESSSPGGRRRPKYSNVQQNDEQESKKLSEESDSRQSPISNQEKSNLLMREDELLDPEYPSPVSVLDDGVYMDDSPSPVKHMPKTLKDDSTKVIKDQWEAQDEDIISSNVTSEINRKKLQNIEHLVQKLTRLNSSHDEAHTDYIASLCENTKPNDRYISEILLASGLLLRDLATFQFHSSGHPINPELFLVLEQTKFSKQEPNSPEKQLKKEKYHRKLIFDIVNEILGVKLASVEPSRRPFKLAKKTLNAQKLLRDLCFEVEELQVKKKKEELNLEEEDDGFKNILWEKVLNNAESWTDYDGELPKIALEVERLIFKDLVNEVVLGEAADGRRIKAGRRCRQLFSK